MKHIKKKTVENFQLGKDFVDNLPAPKVNMTGEEINSLIPKIKYKM